MANSSSITVRPYQTGDEPAVLALFHSAFGRPSTQEHRRWKLKLPCGAVENVWLALADGRPIFQYAGIPTRFWLNQSPATVMVSVDTMTAPDFRRRGLLTRVAGQVYSQWQESGVAFAIGLPNDQWGSRAGALGWMTLFPLQWLVLPLRPETLLARKFNAPLLRRATVLAKLWGRCVKTRIRRDPSVQLERVQHADEAFDQIWNRVKSEWAFSAVRDRDWVNWRFLTSPSRAYEVTLARRLGEPTGYCAHALVRNGEHTSAFLAELLVASADGGTRDSLLRELIQSLQAAGVESLVTLEVPGTAQFRWLRRCGFLRRQAFPVQVVPFDASLPLESMCKPRHWKLSGADFDVI